MQSKLQASPDSPLLTLSTPYAVGLCFGLLYFQSLVPWEMLLSALFLLGGSGLFLVHRKLASDPLSKGLHRLFQGLVFLCVMALGMSRGARSMQEMEPPFPDGSYQALQAVVLEKPVEKAKTFSVVVAVPSYPHKFLLYIAKDSRSRELQAGDFLQVNARLSVPRNYSPDFDYVTYLKTRLISMTGYVGKEHWEKGPAFRLSFLTRIKLKALQTREMLLARLDGYLPEADHRALIHAMLLGDKTDLTPEQKEAYTATGLSHLLALSGMHISFIVLLIGWITWWMPRFLRKVLVLAGTWVFIFIVGLPVSAVRAGVMLTLLLLNPFPYQRTMALDRWALAALLLLLWEPKYLLDVGFQLSFTAVGGILVLLPAVQKMFKGGLSRVMVKAEQGIALCIIAQLSVLPLTLWHFGTFPLYFLLTNIPVSLMLTPLVMYSSMALLAVGGIPVIGPLGAWVTSALLRLQQNIIGFIQHLPGAQLHLEGFGTVSLCLGYLSLAALLNCLLRRNARSIILLQLSLIALLVSLIR